LNPNSTLTPNSALQRLPRAPHEIFSLGWYNTWFYCENHEPDLPAFEGRLPKCQGTWLEEPIPSELALVVALTNKVNALKEHDLTGVYVATHWLAHRIILLKKQVHPRWEYSGTQDPTGGTTKKIRPDHLVKLLEEMFQNVNSWSTDEQVHFF
jgi:hypothetical protein